jgi:hypothetical protein
VSRPAQPLYRPQPVRVRVGEGGVPVEVGGAAVASVREEWVVEDRWWTPRPLRRRYFELILADGRDTVVFRSLTGPRHARTRNGGRVAQWYLQRA